MIPSLTTAQMIEADRAMIEDYHIELIQMMENAGRYEFLHALNGRIRSARVVTSAVASKTSRRIAAKFAPLAQPSGR